MRSALMIMTSCRPIRIKKGSASQGERTFNDMTASSENSFVRKWIRLTDTLHCNTSLLHRRARRIHDNRHTHKAKSSSNDVESVRADAI